MQTSCMLPTSNFCYMAQQQQQKPHKLKVSLSKAVSASPKLSWMAELSFLFLPWKTQNSFYTVCSILLGFMLLQDKDNSNSKTLHVKEIILFYAYLGKKLLSLYIFMKKTLTSHLTVNKSMPNGHYHAPVCWYLSVMPLSPNSAWSASNFPQ